MDNTAKEKIQKHTIPVVKKEIKATLDSIFKHRKHSKSIGLRLKTEDNKLKYIHTDGEEYRPFYDSNDDKYYFINNNDQTEWCK